MWNKEDIRQLYEAIPQRKSVRKYEDRPLTDDVVQQIQSALDKVRIIFPDAPVAVQLLSNTVVKGKFTTPNAPYIAVYANREPKAYANAGSILDQMQLWLSSQGIGSWIHGLASPVKPYDTKDGLPFVLILTAGYAAEPVHRNSPEEYRRNDVSAFFDNDSLKPYAETMRLAASGRNRQPWRIRGNAEKFSVYTIKDNKLFAAMMPDLWVLEGGIAMTHLWLEAEHQGKEITFSFDPGNTGLTTKETYISTMTVL